MSQHQAAFVLLSFARFMPPQEPASPFELPSDMKQQRHGMGAPGCICKAAYKMRCPVHGIQQFPLPSETAPDGLRQTKQTKERTEENERKL